MNKYVDPYIIIQRFGIESVVTSSAEQFEKWKNDNPDAKTINWDADLQNVIGYTF